MDEHHFFKIGFDQDPTEIDIDKMIGSTLFTKLATSHRPIPDPYKFLQAALHELRAFIVAFEADEGRAAVLAALDGRIDQAETLRRLPSDSVWFLPRRK